MKSKYIKTSNDIYVDISLLPLIKYTFDDYNPFLTKYYTVTGYASFEDETGVILGYFENEQLCLEYIHEITEYKYPAYRGMDISDLFKYLQRKKEEKEHPIFGSARRKLAELEAIEKANPKFCIIEEADRPD
jgi:hypothetical protein